MNKEIDFDIIITIVTNHKIRSFIYLMYFILLAIAIAIFDFSEWKLISNIVSNIILLDIFLVALHEVSNEKDVFVILYFYFLTFITSTFLLFFCVESGFISENGNFIGSIGEIAGSIYSGLIDVVHELIILLSILSIAVLPQLLTYIFMGVFYRCAVIPHYIKTIIELSYWFIIKSFITSSGILGASVTLYYMLSEEFVKANEMLNLKLFYMSATLLLFATFLLLLYRIFSFSNLENIVNKFFPTNTHKWMTSKRKLKDSEESMMNKAITFIESNKQS